MKVYETPEVEVINFAAEDIIAASEIVPDYTLGPNDTPLG